LLVRGDIDFVEHGHLDPGRYCRVRLSTSAGTMNVVVVDIVNHVLQDRAVPMAKLRDVTAPCDGEPLLVVGDFNTPADSVHFQPLRGELLNAFEAAGAGYAPTWPVPLPVVQIDHVWANRHVVLHNCRQQSTLRSDHRMVIVDFSLSP
jgi:endonuclease/exonuclease/phosphatase (EEP) superfamily protein YafD